MTDTKSSTKSESSLEELITDTLARLFNCYQLFDSTKGELDFIREFLEPLATSENGDGGSILKEFLRIQHSNPSANLQYAPLLVSCAYCLQAMKAAKSEEREKAWSYMAEARYWCGVSQANTGLEAARDKTIQATRSNAARKGGVARHKKHHDLREEAFRLAREGRPEKGWHSRRQAAKRIATILSESLSPSQAEKTIYEWLATMPDATALFSRKLADNKR